MIKEEIAMPLTEAARKLCKVLKVARGITTGVFVATFLQFVNEDIVPERMIGQMIVTAVTVALIALLSDLLDMLQAKIPLAEQNDLCEIVAEQKKNAPPASKRVLKKLNAPLL